MRSYLIIFVLLALMGVWFMSVAPAAPLAPFPDNPNYFRGMDGKPVYLVGDYTWGTLATPDFDYVAQFAALKANHLNLARVWVFWASDGWDFEGVHLDWLCPFLRTGPGLASDGKPKYDLGAFDPTFFERLSAMCEEARRQGVYLQLTLFDAWNIKHPEIWKFHAFNAANNINGADGDPRGTGRGTDSEQGYCSLGNRNCMRYQKGLIRQVVETVNRFDNIYFEIANENYYSSEWELALADYLKELEARLPKQHLVMPADIPNHDEGGIKTWNLADIHSRLPAMLPVGQPVIMDTDGIGNPEDVIVRNAAWTACVSGGHFSYLDDTLQPGVEYHGDESGSLRPEIRAQLGYLAEFVNKLPFWRMKPLLGVGAPGKGYCLGDGESGWVVYLPAGGTTELALGLEGKLKLTWLDPVTGKRQKAGKVSASQCELTCPFAADGVALLAR